MLNINQSQKRNFVKVIVVLMAAGHFSLTANFLSGILNMPLPLVSGFTVKDLTGLLGFVAFILLHKREV
jgi:hypothetical protein